MTREEIMNTPAGAEMNTLVFESVFGMRLEKNHGFAGGSYWVGNGITFGERMKHDVPEYSTDIAAAWEVLEKMREDCSGGGEPDYITLVCYKELEPIWYCAKIWAHHDGDIPEFEATANTAPLAICRAALLALLNI